MFLFCFASFYVQKKSLTGYCAGYYPVKEAEREVFTFYCEDCKSYTKEDSRQGQLVITVQILESRGTLIFAQANLNCFLQKFCACIQNAEKLIYFCDFFLQISIFAQLSNPRIISFFAFFLRIFRNQFL